MICKHCGGEIMEKVTDGKGYYYHCLDFGDCKNPKPTTKSSNKPIKINNDNPEVD